MTWFKKYLEVIKQTNWVLFDCHLNLVWQMPPYLLTPYINIETWLLVLYVDHNCDERFGWAAEIFHISNWAMVFWSLGMAGIQSEKTCSPQLLHPQGGDTNLKNEQSFFWATPEAWSFCSFYISVSSLNDLNWNMHVYFQKRKYTWSGSKRALLTQQKGN